MSIIDSQMYDYHKYNNNDLQLMAARKGQTAVGKKDEKLNEVCQEFESLFIKQMLDVMRKTVQKSGLMDGGMAENIFEDMLYEKYALSMAQSARFGISDALYRQLSSISSMQNE